LSPTAACFGMPQIVTAQRGTAQHSIARNIGTCCTLCALVVRAHAHLFNASQPSLQCATSCRRLSAAPASSSFISCTQGQRGWACRLSQKLGQAPQTPASHTWCMRHWKAGRQEAERAAKVQLRPWWSLVAAACMVVTSSCCLHCGHL